MASYIEFDNDIPVSPLHRKAIDTDTLSLDIKHMKFLDTFDLFDENLTTESSSFITTTGMTTSFPPKLAPSLLLPLRPASPLAVTVPFDFPSDNALSLHDTSLSRSSSYMLNNHHNPPLPSSELHRDQSDSRSTSSSFGFFSFGLPMVIPSSSTTASSNYPLVRERSDASLNSEFLHMETNTNNGSSTTHHYFSSKPSTTEAAAIFSSLVPTTKVHQPINNVKRGEGVGDKNNSIINASSTPSITTLTGDVVVPSSLSSSNPITTTTGKNKNNKRFREHYDDDAADDDDEDDDDEEEYENDEDDDNNDEINQLYPLSMTPPSLNGSATTTTVLTSTPATTTTTGSPNNSSPYQDIHNLVVLPLPIIRSLGKKGGRIPYPLVYRYETNEGRSLYPENTQMIGVYSYSHRMNRLQQWENLRNRRIFYKKVKYRQRRLLANGRQRVKGRFVKEAAPLTITSPLVFSVPPTTTENTTTKDTSVSIMMDQ